MIRVVELLELWNLAAEDQFEGVSGQGEWHRGDFDRKPLGVLAVGQVARQTQQRHTRQRRQVDASNFSALKSLQMSL